MWQNFKPWLEAKKKQLVKLNPLAICGVALAFGTITLLASKSIQIKNQWQAEIRSTQFNYAREISQHIFEQKNQLAKLLRNAENNERVYHLDALFQRAKYDRYEPEGANNFAKLTIKNSGRFTATDKKGQQYKASQFHFASFPTEAQESFWFYNAALAGATAVIPERDSITVANVPVNWLHETMRTFADSSTFQNRINIPNEKFEWAILARPSTETEENTHSEQMPKHLPTTNSDTDQEAKHTNNIIIANSDSLEFGSELSNLFEKSQILNGPNQYRSLTNSLTEQSGLAIIKIQNSNLHLMTKWTAKWSMLDLVGLYNQDLLIMFSLMAVFILASLAYKFRFTELTSELKAALLKLNPSTPASIESSRLTNLESTFNEIFDSSVWLYKLASSRQHKYGALSEFTKSQICSENVFLTYVNEELIFPDFRVILNQDSSWRIALIQSPYNSTCKLFLLIHGDSSLARIVMYTFTVAYIRGTHQNADLMSIITTELNKIAQLAEKLNIQALCIIADAESLNNGSVIIEKSRNTTFDATVEPEIVYLRNEEGKFDFCFTTKTNLPDAPAPSRIADLPALTERPAETDATESTASFKSDEFNSPESITDEIKLMNKNNIVRGSNTFTIQPLSEEPFDPFQTKGQRDSDE